MTERDRFTTLAFLEAACELIAGGDADGAELVLGRAIEDLEPPETHPEPVS